MDNERILEAARKNKGRGDEYENRVASRGTLWSTFVSLFVTGVLLFTEYCSKGTANIGLLAVLFTTLSVQYLHDGIKMRKVVFIIIGSVELLVAIACLFVYLGQVVSK